MTYTKPPGWVTDNIRLTTTEKHVLWAVLLGTIEKHGVGWWLGDDDVESQLVSLVSVGLINGLGGGVMGHRPERWEITDKGRDFL